jgi:hypothetical protein
MARMKCLWTIFVLVPVATGRAIEPDSVLARQLINYRHIP